jgi:hypothetical protein
MLLDLSDMYGVPMLDGQHCLLQKRIHINF